MACSRRRTRARRCAGPSPRNDMVHVTELFCAAGIFQGTGPLVRQLAERGSGQPAGPGARPWPRRPLRSSRPRRRRCQGGRADRRLDGVASFPVPDVASLVRPRRGHARAGPASRGGAPGEPLRPRGHEPGRRPGHHAAHAVDRARRRPVPWASPTTGRRSWTRTTMPASAAGTCASSSIGSAASPRWRSPPTMPARPGWPVAPGQWRSPRPQRVRHDRLDRADPVLETRNYVQRVMEAMQVYRALLERGTLRMTQIQRAAAGERPAEPPAARTLVSAGGEAPVRACVFDAYGTLLDVTVGRRPAAGRAGAGGEGAGRAVAAEAARILLAALTDAQPSGFLGAHRRRARLRARGDRARRAGSIAIGCSLATGRSSPIPRPGRARAAARRRPRDGHPLERRARHAARRRRRRPARRRERQARDW